MGSVGFLVAYHGHTICVVIGTLGLATLPWENGALSITPRNLTHRCLDITPGDRFLSRVFRIPAGRLHPAALGWILRLECWDFRAKPTVDT